jgi:hypothetical protein
MYSRQQHGLHYLHSRKEREVGAVSSYKLDPIPIERNTNHTTTHTHRCLEGIHDHCITSTDTFLIT